MISKPKHGWSFFQIGSFGCDASYLTDVPLDLLDCFLSYYEKGAGIANFDAESYGDFCLILNGFDVYIIENNGDAILHNFSELNVNDLAQDLVNDIETNLSLWEEWEMSKADAAEWEELDDWNERAAELKEKLERLKNTLKEKGKIK